MTAASPSIVAAAERVEIRERYGSSLRGTIDGFPFLLLRGTHYERGEAHGTLAAREILLACDRMASFVNRQAGGWKAAIEAARRFQLAPAFQTELAGMLAGIRSRLPSYDRQLKSLGREVQLDDLRVLQTGDLFELARCSQFSAWGELTPDGQVIVGRNFDYPPLFPRDACCLIAVEPSEAGLRPTLDALWFGMLGAGMVTLRDDGLYLAANSGGRAQPVEFEAPVPGALLLRSFVRTATADDPSAQLASAMRGRVVLPIIIHLVPPADTDRPTARAIEYALPEKDENIQDVAEVRVRKPSNELPSSLFIANHFIRQNADLGEGRSGTIRRCLKTCLERDKPIDFAEAVQILETVRQGDTYYSAVVWPQTRRMKVAVVDPERPLAQASWTSVGWDDLFSLD